ncbi:MAG: carboxypeptidase regulatory-like domain-containing protein, partial [Clostridiales bacterium]|nr:carboxypeptidase regulatory-like domain-containing protein [Clostridiales bacterium]
MLLRDKKSKRLLAFFIAFAMILSDITFMPKSASAAPEPGFLLTMTNMPKRNGIKAEWNDISASHGGQDFGYRYYQRMLTDGENMEESLKPEWELRSAKYGRPIKVLVISPNNTNVQQWMKNDIPTVDPYNLMNMTTINQTYFDGLVDPASALKDINGKYNYDVVVLGTENRNGGISYSPKNAKTVPAIRDFLQSGRGVLFGHGSFSEYEYVTNLKDDQELDWVYTGTKDHFGDKWMYTALRHYIGVIADGSLKHFAHEGPLTTGKNSYIKIVEPGWLLRFPIKLPLEGVLQVPDTHVNSSMTKGRIWMKFTDDKGNLSNYSEKKETDDSKLEFSDFRSVLYKLEYLHGTSSEKKNFRDLYLIPNNLYGVGDKQVMFDDGEGNGIAEYHSNYFLSTYNNAATIQTGHSDEKATNAERSIVSNTLFYLAQLTFDTNLDDFSAIDYAAPSQPAVTLSDINNGKVIAKISSQDQGTWYEGRVEASGQSNGAQYESNVAREETVSGVRGYYVKVSTSQNYDPYDATKTGDNFVGQADGVNYVESQVDESVAANSYMHVRAIDWSGNLSPVYSVKLSDIIYSVNVTVLDDDNDAPIPGAIVRMLEKTLYTEQNGTARMTADKTGSYVVMAAASGYAPNSASVVLSGNSASLTIRLSKTPYGFIWGCVRDTTGQPIAGVEVSLPGVGLTGETDGAGYYYISNAPTPATYTILASKSGYNGGYATGLTLESQGYKRRDFTLTEQTGSNNAYIVSGKVTDVDSAEALENVRVKVDNAVAFTDSYGWYVTGYHDAGDKVVAAGATGYRDLYVNTAVSIVSSDVRHDLTLKKDQGLGEVEVTVVEKGTTIPIRNVNVFLGYSGPFATGNDGKVTIREIAIGSYTMRAEAGYYNVGYYNATSSLIEFAQGEPPKTATIEMEPGTLGAMYGRVIDNATGAGVDGATVKTMTGQTTVTNAQGYYILPDLEGMKYYSVMASHTDYNTSAARAFLNPSAYTTQNFYINAIDGTPEHIIYGQLTEEENGEVVADAEMMANVSNFANTDSFGYYILTGFADGGDVNIEARKAPFKVVKKSVMNITADERVDIALPLAIMITFKGVDVNDGQNVLYSVQVRIPTTRNYLFNPDELNIVGTAGYVRTDGGGAIEINPATFEDPEVIIPYRYNKEMVTVQAVFEKSDGSYDVLASFQMEAVIGGMFEYTKELTHYSGYEFSRRDQPKLIYADAENVYNLYYVKSQGNMRIAALDVDDPSYIIGYRDYNVALHETVTADDDWLAPHIGDVEELQYYDFEPGSGRLFKLDSNDDVDEFVYDGYTMDYGLSFNFKRRTEDISIKLLDDETGDDIKKTVIPDVTVQAGRSTVINAVDYASYVSDGYTLVGESSKIVNSNLTGPYEVSFYYRKTPGSVTVNLVEKDTSDIIQTIYYPATTDSQSIAAPTVAGWTHDPSDAASKNAVAGETVQFVYTRSVATVNIAGVYAADGSPVPQASLSPNSVTFASGLSGVIYAPHLQGYDPVAYSTDGGATWTDGTTASFTAAEVAALTTVTFKYARYNTVKLNVKYVDDSDSKEIYSYTMDFPADYGLYSIQAKPMHRYSLIGAPSRDVTITNSDVTAEFRFKSLKTRVEIKAEDGSGAPVPGFTPYYETAYVNEPFTLNAPYISYWTADDVSLTIPSVSENDEMKFVYTRETGNYTLFHVESSDDPNYDGRILATTNLNAWPPAQYEIDIPYYEASAQQPDIGDGQVSGSSRVERNVYYTRLTSQVAVNYQNGLGEPIAASDDYTFRMGESAVVFAKPISGYRVTNPAVGAVVTIPENPNETITFTYGAIDDGVIEIYSVDAVSGKTLQYNSMTVAPGGSAVVTAPKIYGYRLQDPASSPVNAAGGDAVMFAYVEDYASVTINVVDENGNDIMPPIARKAPIGLPYTAYAPNVKGYALADFSKGSRYFSSVQGGEECTFTYRPLDDPLLWVDVNITGVDQDSSATLYAYTVKRPADSGAYTVHAFNQAGYDIVGDDFKTVAIGAGGTYIDVEFAYSSLSSTVTIRAEDGTGAPIADFAPITVAATRGQPFSYNAPYIAGWHIADVNEAVKVITVNGADEEIKFVYDKNAGNVTVLLKEAADGRIIASDSITANEGDTVNYTDLSALLYYTITGATSKTVHLSDPVIEFFYDKTLVTVDVISRDEGQAVITRGGDQSVYPQAGLRKGEVSSFYAYPEEGYRLNDDTVKNALVNDALEASGLSFAYAAIGSGEIVVEAVEDDTNHILQQTRIASMTTLSVQAPNIAGYILQGARSQSVSPGGKATFRYIKNAVNISVKLLDEDTGLEIPAIAGTSAFARAARGTSFTVYAPHAPGYMLTSQPSITFPNVTDGLEAVFYYASLQSVIDKNVVNITVNGLSDGGQKLYSYNMRRDRAAGSVEVSAFDLQGYALITASPAVIAIGDESDLSYTFEYRSLAAEVVIRTVDGADAEISREFAVSATEGQPFSYSAPYVPGWDINDDVYKTIASVDMSVDAGHIITFRYNQATGNVFAVWKENDANGRIIGSESFSITETSDAAARTFSPKDLSGAYYTPISGSKTVNYSPDTQTIEFYYSKMTTSVSVKYMKGAETLDAGSVGNLRVGETAVFAAKSFDNLYVVGDAVKSVLVTALGSQEVIFNYADIPADAIIVEAVDYASAELLSSSVVRAATGSSVTINAPEIVGYKLISEPSKTVVAPGKARFDFAEDNVTVTLVLKDDLGGLLPIPYGTERVTKVPRGTNYVAYAPHAPGYALADGEKASQTFMSVQTNKFAEFTYVPVSNVIDQYAAVVTIIGVDEDAPGEELYSYTVKKQKTVAPLEVSAFELPGYELIDPASSPAYVDISVASEAEHRFTYRSLATEVSIRAEEYGTGGQLVPGFRPVTAPAVKGSPFGHSAPYIEGWSVVSASETYKTIDSVLGGEVMTFVYTQNTGNVTVLWKENDANGKIIGSRSETVGAGGATINADDLSGVNYTPVGPNQINVAYSAQPQTVEFYYAKNVKSVQVKYVEDYGDSEIMPPTDYSSLRVGEPFTFNALYVSNMIVKGAVSVTKIVTAALDEVVFRYKPIPENVIVVESVDEYGSLIQRSTVTASNGVTMSITAPAIPGYALTSASRQTVTAPGKATFEFREDSVNVTLSAVTAQGTPIPLPSGVQGVTKAARGSMHTVYAPHIPGYVLMSVTQSVTFRATAARTVEFEYARVQEALEGYLVNITVEGLDASGNELYSYSFTSVKDTGDITVNAMPLPNYELTSAASQSVPTTGDSIVTFNYASLATVVTIEAVDDLGTAISGFTPIVAPAVKGQPFSYAAPYINGWNLIDKNNFVKTINSVDPSADAGHIMTFAYGKSIGNVTVVLKEDDTNGAIIAVRNEEADINGLEILPEDLSSLYYTLIGPVKHDVAYSDQSQTVEFYYEKEVTNVTVEHRDSSGGALLQSETINDVRLGETYTFNSVAIAGKTVMGAASRAITVDRMTSPVVFSYVGVLAGVISVDAQDELGNVLRSFTIYSVPGTDMTVAAPAILGYKLTAGEQASKAVQSPGTVSFIYEKDEVRITAELKDSNGQSLTPPAGYQPLIQVPRGVSSVIYAPHLSGYLISGNSSATVDGDADETVTFSYISVQEAVNEYVTQITVRGADETGKTLYSYSFTKPRNGENAKVTAFALSGYRLTTPSPAVVDAANKAVAEHTFQYESLETTVTINAVETG